MSPPGTIIQPRGVRLFGNDRKSKAIKVKSPARYQFGLRRSGCQEQYVGSYVVHGRRLLGKCSSFACSGARDGEIASGPLNSSDVSGGGNHVEAISKPFNK